MIARSSLIAAIVLPVFAACAGAGDDPSTAASRAAARVKDTPSAALARLDEATGRRARTSANKATGAARFVSLPPAASAAIGQGPARSAQEKANRSAAFFRDFGAAVGVTDPGSMRLESAVTDGLGETHLTFRQVHRGVPVHGAMVKTHFDASDRLKGVNGTALPAVAVDPVPTVSAEAAAVPARNRVEAERGPGAGLRAGTSKLVVYREGLARGVPGDTHLAWEIEIVDGAGIRDLVYVSAHTGKVIDRVAGIHDDLYRRVYDGHGFKTVPANYPNGVFWLEGDELPTPFVEANNMIVATEETHRFFDQAFGRDSYDGAGHTMEMIFNRGYGCPNASWNGSFISFCPGFTTDDVTTHEWGHAYTQHTHGLIYAWQPGALNEAYSDIWGETVDLINGRGGDDPAAARAEGECSSFSPPVSRLRVHAPASIAGPYLAQAASFGAPLTTAGITGDIVAAIDDGANGAELDGCTELVNAAEVEGKIALVNRGSCEFGVKALNAQNAGAIAVIVANNTSGLALMGAGLVGGQVTIPAISVLMTDGATLRGALAEGPVSASVLAEEGQDESKRWLMGEDITNEDLPGALRDMWSPNCYSNPASVGDPFYWCSADDEGGVHINSGIPNKAFALLVDGGSFNGQTVRAIGLTKAAHVYFRAQTVYQVADSDFADHADALETSCADLEGQTLTALTGGPSDDVIDADDCRQVAAAIAAVELRRTPPCGPPPLLDPNAPAMCSPSDTTGQVQSHAAFDFETQASLSGWTVSHTPASPDFTERDWELVDLAPIGKSGQGFFAANPSDLGTCQPGGDESGVLHLTSPPITLSSTSDGFARATFEHWFATEPGWDGGNLRVSVNGGPWQLVPPAQFTFNGYPFLLFGAAQGNTNPLAGQPAWTSVTPATVNGGSYGRTHVNLAGMAAPGDTVQLRWDFGSDGCNGRVGWYVDNVNVFSCTPNVPRILGAAGLSFPEGNAGTTARNIIVVLDRPTVKRVTMDWTVVEGTAQHGNDFEKLAGGTLVFAPGQTQAAITVVVKGDTVSEGNEGFTLRLSNVINASPAGGGALPVTILDDDAPATPYSHSSFRSPAVRSLPPRPDGGGP